MATTLSQRHEIPTHLNVEDKPYYGLSIRQVTYLVSGFSVGYGLWTENPNLLLGLRGGAVVVCLMLALALALLRPFGRGLEEWAIIALRYLTVPKVSTWRAGTEPPADRHRMVEDWLGLTPRPGWTREGDS